MGMYVRTYMRMYVCMYVCGRDCEDAEAGGFGEPGILLLLVVGAKLRLARFLCACCVSVWY